MIFPLILLGLCIGSFLNVVICRVPAGDSIVSPPSHCPSCKKRIGTRDLIPVISWLLLKGRCRSCRTRISIRYPATELFTALVFLWAYAVFGYSIQLIPALILASVLIAVSQIDWDVGIIPFSILAFAAAPGLIFSILNINISFKDSLLGALVGGGFIIAVDVFSRLVFKRHGMGGGDVAMMLTAGLFLGFGNTLLAMFLAVITGGIYAAFLLALKRAEKNSTFAFGPFLAVGVWVALLHGNGIIEWYLYRGLRI